MKLKSLNDRLLSEANISFLFFVLLLFLSTQGMTQVSFEEPKEAEQTSTDEKKKEGGDSDSWDRLFTGGNLGLQFGNSTIINVSPLIGYKVTEKFHTAIGVTYQYFSFRDRFTSFSSSVIGGRLLARYFIYSNFFAHGEYEVLNGEWSFLRPDERFNVTSIFVGGGYSQSLGPRAQLNFMLLWNINESIYSPYVNPVIRMGIGVGL